jgi:spermidine/putrescine transport system permease protein
MFLLILFMYVPILTLVVFSFNAKDSRVSWGGFSLRWYERLFSNQTIMMSLLNTVIIAVITSVISTILGTAASIGINNLKKTPRAVVMNITYVPIINPEIITGVSLMLLFKMFISLTPVKFGSFTLIPKLQFGYLTLILAHISFCVPYVIYNVLPKLRQLNPNLVEAAEDLGCSPHQAFFKVVIPEILPGVFSGFIMALTYSLDDFVVSYFNSGSSINTLPITIQSMTKRKIHPDINALSTLIFLVILIILVTKNILDNRRLRKEAEDARLKFSEN